MNLPPFDYVVVTIICCLVFGLALLKLDRQDRTNFWVFCGVGLLGMLLICLVLRLVAFGF